MKCSHPDEMHPVPGTAAQLSPLFYKWWAPHHKFTQLLAFFGNSIILLACTHNIISQEYGAALWFLCLVRISLFFFFFFSAKDYSNCKTSLFFKFCNPPAPMQYWDDTEIWVNVFICSIFPSNKAGIVIVSISFFFVLSHFLFLNNYSQVQRLQWSLNQPFLETQKRFQWLPILFWKVNLPLLAMTNYLIRKVFISTAKNSFWN